MYDCIIIGAGPAGMSAAIYLKNAGKKVLLIEKNTPGGKILKAKKINNYLGLNNLSPEDISYEMYNQVIENGINIYIEKVLEINKNDNDIIVSTNKNKYKSKYILLTCGRVEKGLNLKLEEELIGKGVSYCTQCDGSLYKDKTVTVIGNSSESISDTIYLSKIASSVIYINYSNENVKFKENNVNVINNRKIIELIKENDVLKKVKLDNDEIINTNGLFILTGYTPNTGFIEKLNLKTENGYIVVDSTMKTSEDKIYAAGDIIKKDLYQIITAASEGAIAAVNIAKLLN